MLFFVAAEAMFFAGLIAAYWVIRANLPVWPPVGQPRLPVLVTGINTALLLISGLAMWETLRAARKGCQSCVIGALGLAGLLGAVFLGIQGYEWARLIRFGLGTRENVYGGTFYLIVGAHGLHVFAGLLFLWVVLFKALRGRYEESRPQSLSLCRIYWTFVVLLWPILYAIIYF